MPLFISNDELSLISHDAAAIAEKADSYISQLKAELAEVQEQNHQLHLQSIGKDGEIERLMSEVSELNKTKRQLIELVEEKDAAIKSYVDRIALESSTITRIKKRKKNRNPTKCQTMISGRDRISELPDTIIYEILSRLPTKDAVATTILSKRWKDQWTYSFNLDFNDRASPSFIFSRSFAPDEATDTCYVNVKDVIASNQSPYIKKFRLSSLTMDGSDFTECLDSILRRNVEEIELDAVFDFIPLTLPQSLFTCQTLVFLDIASESIYDIPPSVHLPSLKVFSVQLYDASDAVQTKLFCGLPVLEDLSVSIWLSEEMTLNIFTPSLKRLELHLEIIEEPRNLYDYQIVVRAPSLKELDIFEYHVFEYHYIMTNYVFEELPLDVRVRLGVGGCPAQIENEELAVHTIQLLNRISHVNSLALSGCILGRLDFGNMPVFTNVTCLEVDITRCSGFTYLPYLIEKLPNLVVLFLKMVTICRELGPLGHVPQCLLLHLKRIEVRGFGGQEYELKLLVYLLKVAQVLDEVVIYTHSIALKERKNLCHKLSSFPRGSKNCQFKILKGKKCFFMCAD